MAWRNAVNLSHHLVEMVVETSDVVIDATCGNGKDTLFLARLVPEGKVLAFDRSSTAIARTLRLMEENGFRERVVLFNRDFRDIPLLVETKVKAIMFNLGYLPGASRDTATCLDESVPAILGALPLLATGGVMTVVCYTGHEGGMKEAQGVLEALTGLDQKKYEVLAVSFVNQINDPPRLFAVYKL